MLNELPINVQDMYQLNRRITKFFEATLPVTIQSSDISRTTFLRNLKVPANIWSRGVTESLKGIPGTPALFAELN